MLEETLAAELDGAAPAVVAQIRAEVPALFVDPRHAELALAGARDLLHEFATALRHGLDDRFHAPTSAVAYARELARAGLPLSDVLRSYRVGQAAAFGRAAAVAADTASLARVGALSFRFADAVMTEVTEAFDAERQRRLRETAARREAVLEAVLDGTPPPDAEAVLGYRLDGTHQAAIVLGDVPVDGFPLVVGNGVWRRGRTRWAPVAGAQLAVGSPGDFVTTRRQAERAATVAPLLPARAVVHYADVALAALLLRDPDAAQAFAVEELAGIEDATVRATLQAYFDAGHDASAAAAVLGVHRNTVTRRLAPLGRRLLERRRELEAALVIAGLLPPATALP